MKQTLLASPHTGMATEVKQSVSYPSEAISEDLIHELRQPLSVIETLAYYLELTASNEKALAHSQHIQAMVQKVNRILAAACEPSLTSSLADPPRARSAAS